MTHANGPVDDEAVAEMVAACRPEWRVTDYDRAAEGTDFVAFVDCETPEGSREAVLKATTAGFVDPTIARAEPRLYELLGRETSIPVPAVYGYVDEHSTHPAPFSLLERVAGRNYESDVGSLPADVREQVCREAGANLAELHELRTFDRVGSVGVRDGDLAVVSTEEDGPFTDGREWFSRSVEETLDSLADGTYFPEMADEPRRFTDLVPSLRAVFEERLAEMPAPDRPRFCHWDYRYGNLLLDADRRSRPTEATTGVTAAVLDLANLSSTDPAYNLAAVEYHLLHDRDDPAIRARHRAALRDAYAAGREAWTFDAAVRERMDLYVLKKRCDAMACLPLWHAEKAQMGRARVERLHREAVAEWL